ncbi:MAG TPA: hypothetical protein VHV30_17455 [Polyangiaceae bacterium]|jgi:hypothetical protein|nr:hypothetical protein [Polyangiaceae bacterium]
MSSELTASLFAASLASSFAAYRIGAALRAAYPSLALVEGEDWTFEFDRFADAGRCKRAPVAGLHLEAHTHWNAPLLVAPDALGSTRGEGEREDPRPGRR